MIYYCISDSIDFKKGILEFALQMGLLEEANREREEADLQRFDEVIYHQNQLHRGVYFGIFASDLTLLSPEEFYSLIKLAVL